MATREGESQAERAQLSMALSRSAAGAATTEAEAAVIREARANIEREKVRYFVEEEEILELLDLHTLDELNDVLPYLQATGFPPIGRAVKLGSYFAGTPEVPTVRAVRFQVERWFERFDLIARRLGYVKVEHPAAVSASSRAGRVAVAGVFVLMALGFMG